MKVTKGRWPRLSYIQSLSIYICAKHIAELCREGKKIKTWAIPSRKLMSTCEEGKNYSSNKYLMLIKPC